MLPKIKIKAGHEKRILNGSPWIYSNEIDNFSEIKSLEKGGLVEVIINGKQQYGLGYFNPNCLIAARLLSKDVNSKIDENFFIQKILTAKSLRDRFFTSSFYRLVHSEADFLPGLVIDRFDNYFSCQISTYGIENLQQYLVLALEKIFPKSNIIFRNDMEARKIEGLELYNRVVAGNGNFTEVEIIENDLKFLVDLTTGQKTGWFFDQRKNRQFIGEISQGLEVLDLFCYNGGFGLNALKNGAKNVTFVDSSAKALEKLNSNLQLNNFDLNSFKIINKKVVDLLEDNEFAQKRFDLVVLDPPALIKSKKDFFAGLKLYEKLIKLSSSLVRKNGFLFVASCSHNLSNLDLISAANSAFKKAKRKARIIRQFGADIDHPIHYALKENEYLKSLCFFLD